MNKPWYKSKTVWGSVILGAVGVAQIVMNGEINVESITLLASSLGLFGLRDAL